MCSRTLSPAETVWVDAARDPAAIGGLARFAAWCARFINPFLIDWIKDDQVMIQSNLFGCFVIIKNFCYCKLLWAAVDKHTRTVRVCRNRVFRDDGGWSIVDGSRRVSSGREVFSFFIFQRQEMRTQLSWWSLPVVPTSFLRVEFQWYPVR